MTATDQSIPTAADDVYFAGDTAIIRDEISNPDGTAKDLSGASVSFVLSDYPGDDPIITKDTSGGGVEITDAVNGVVEVAIDSADTQSLGGPHGERYFYKITVTDGTDTSAVTTGDFTITASST